MYSVLLLISPSPYIKNMSHKIAYISFHNIKKWWKLSKLSNHT